MKWISVKDRLPDNDEDVWVCDINAENDYSYPYTVKQSYAKAFFCKGKWVYSELDGVVEADDITHWMPLPEPPVTPE